MPDGPVATLLGKIEGGLDHWLTFIGEPAVSPTNNAAENALREPVILRKIIGLCSFGTRQRISRISDTPAKVVDGGFQQHFTEL